MAGRKKTTTTPIVEEALATDVIEATAQDQNAATEHSMQIIEQFGGGIPYSRPHYIATCKNHLARSAEEAMHAGRCLVVMKEHEPHGEWISILDELGLDRTLAARMMQAATKLSNVATSQHLVEAAKSKSKLFELMILDDEQLEQLGDGGSVMGLDLDDIDRMPVSQLRTALRQAKEKDETKDQILADKNTKIDDLSSQLASAKRRIRSMSVEETTKVMRKEAAEVAYDAEINITANLRNAFSTLIDHETVSGTDHRKHMAMLLQHLALSLAAIRDEFCVPVISKEDVQAWTELLGVGDLDLQDE